MQQINTERQQASGRLLQQLPANTIKETTSPSRHKHVNKNSLSAPNRFDKLTTDNLKQWSSRRLQTDLGDFDTYRSLSTCPTYSSLSRHSPETRECATQITTFTPIQAIEDNEEISYDSPSPIDNNQVLLIDEIPFEKVELMPISSGYGYYPYNYPTTITERVPQSQLVSRPSQFRNNQRDKNQNGIDPNSKIKPTGKFPPPRPTAVKQDSPRADTFVSPTRKNEMNPKVSKNNPVQDGSRRIPSNETTVKKPSPPPERRRTEIVPRNGVTRPVSNHPNSFVDQQDYGRKPIRFANKHNTAYYPPASSDHYQQPAYSPRDASDRPRHIRVARNEYVVQRRRPPPPDYMYDDHRANSPIERRKTQRVIRVVRDNPYREDDDVYYDEPPPSRRPAVVRRSPPREYVYVDEAPAPIRRPRSRRPEVVYVDEDQPIEYEDEYIYVDEDGNEVDFKGKQNHSPQYVEYAYDDDKDKRRPHKSKVVYVEDDDKDKRRSNKPKVVYVDDDDKDKRRSNKSKVVYVEDDPPINQGRDKKKSKPPSSTRIIYE